MFALIAGSMILTACGGAPANTTPTVDPLVLKTQIYQTVEAELTRSALLTPTATVTPTITPTATLAPTTAVGSPTVAITLAPTGSANQGEFISQSVPDDTKVNPGSTFTMTWTIKNVGTTTWSTSYLIRFYAGETFGTKSSQPMPKTVAPGETVDITMSLKAPTAAGTYEGTWVLTDTTGINFRPFNLRIVVGNATATPTTPATAAATETATPTTTATP